MKMMVSIFHVSLLSFVGQLPVEKNSLFSGGSIEKSLPGVKGETRIKIGCGFSLLCFLDNEDYPP